MQHIGARTGSGPRDRGPPWFTLVPARDVAHLRRARGQLMIGFGAARSESGKGCGVKALRVRDILVLAPLWVWPVLAAPFVGTFLGVGVTRARVPQSILVGRSACERRRPGLGLRPRLAPGLLAGATARRHRPRGRQAARRSGRLGVLGGAGERPPGRFCRGTREHLASL